MSLMLSPTNKQSHLSHNLTHQKSSQWTAAVREKNSMGYRMQFLNISKIHKDGTEIKMRKSE